jgi:hypothetical protein
MFGLATCPYLPKSGMQGEKGGDFLSVLLKKYYPNLAWRIAFSYRFYEEFGGFRKDIWKFRKAI